MPEKVVLNWKSPALEQVACQLVEAFCKEEEVDLRSVLVVLPVQRAGRRLLELLLTEAERRLLRLIPPRIITVGGLPELLIERSAPYASTLERAVSWSEAVLSLPEEVLKSVFETLPPTEELSSWLPFSRELEQLWQQLAANRLTFKDVLQKVQESGFEFEEERWSALCHLFDQYLSALNTRDVFDKHHFRLSVGSDVAFRRFEAIYLVHCLELPAIHEHLLVLSRNTVRVMVLGDPEQENHFDEWGRPDIPFWSKAQFEVPSSQITRVAQPVEQCLLVLDKISEWQVQNPDEVSIGIVDEELLPVLQQTFTVQDVSFRSSVGLAGERSPLYSLLQLTEELLRTDSFSAFARFVRHPLVQQYLAKSLSKTEILSLVDAYFQKHLPARFTLFTELVSGEEIEPILHQVRDLLAPFRKGTRRFSGWAPEIGEFLDRFVDDSRATSLLLQESARVVSLQLEEYIVELSRYPKEVSAREALSLFLFQLRQSELYPQTSERAVEGIGWLELALDDAPNLVVVGFQQGLVPERGQSDIFLPESLRRALFLPNFETREARDRYLVQCLLNGKKELHFLFSELSLTGEFTLPSPLLFQTRSDSDMPERVLRLLDEDSAQKRAHRVLLPRAESSTVSLYSIPKPEVVEAQRINTISATAFRDYIACPYRFYLKHIRKLRAVHDQALELDGAAFGALLHLVLERFARSPAARAESEDEVISVLFSELDRVFHDRFGRTPLPAVILQREQLRYRLLSYARWHSQWCARGWQVHSVEDSLSDDECVLMHPSGETIVRGRIDRIDYHPETNRYAVLDFKTFEKSRSPQETHRSADGSWLDLQLPLYATAMQKRFSGTEVLVGYLCLSTEEEYSEQFAPWSQDDLSQAHHLASQIAYSITKQEFWPPTEDSLLIDDFSVICGVGQFTELFDEPDTAL